MTPVERIIKESKAMRLAGLIGRLVLTERELTFTPSRLNLIYRSKPFSIPLSEVKGASVRCSWRVCNLVIETTRGRNYFGLYRGIPITFVTSFKGLHEDWADTINSLLPVVEKPDNVVPRDTRLAGLEPSQVEALGRSLTRLLIRRFLAGVAAVWAFFLVLELITLAILGADTWMYVALGLGMGVPVAAIVAFSRRV